MAPTLAAPGMRARHRTAPAAAPDAEPSPGPSDGGDASRPPRPPSPELAPTPDAAWLLSFLPFSRLSTDAANWLASIADVYSIPAGEVIVSPGDPPGLTVIRSGTAVVTSPNADRPYAVGPGAAFGLRAILAGAPIYLGAVAGRAPPSTGGGEAPLPLASPFSPDAAAASAADAAAPPPAAHHHLALPGHHPGPVG